MNVTYRTRALAATRGTQFGAILSCAFGANHGQTPRFEGKAIITSDSFVQCSFVDSNGNARHMAFVGSVSDLVRNVSVLSDHLNLSEEDRTDLRACVTAWVATDYSGKIKSALAG
jgi:hypothetical protein